jgi:hypothetical protein
MGGVGVVGVVGCAVVPGGNGFSFLQRENDAASHCGNSQWHWPSMPPDFYICAVRIDVVEHSALGDRAAMFTLNLECVGTGRRI